MFSWDAQKSVRNLEKHRVSFEEGATVFADEDALDWEDLAHCHSETRFKRLGKSVTGRILIVVKTMRELKNGEERKAYLGCGNRLF